MNPSAAPRQLWRNCTLLDGRIASEPLLDAAVLTQGTQIVCAGAQAACLRTADDDCTVVDLDGRWLTPGLIDCHTHLIFGGNRASEHALRARGASYQEIAAQGGGILSTVRATRAAGDAQLLAAARARIDALRAEGITTVEIKSGYGLDFSTEQSLLRIARQLGRDAGVTVHATFLGAHTLAPEYAGRADDYLKTIIADWLPRLAGEGLIDSVDIYCETLAFSAAQAARLFDAARLSGLPVRMHAEQFSNIGGSLLAASHGALSCDHLEYAGAAEAAAMARSGTVAVLLPMAWHVLRETRKPPVAALRAAQVPIAIASDCNPGSAPGESLQLAMSLAARDFGLQPAELLAAVTSNAARALGLQTERGQIVAGQRADFAVWDISSCDEFGYWLGHNPCVGTVRNGSMDARLAAALATKRTT